MTSRLYDPQNPLSPAWLASVLEKKLTKQQYLRASIPESTKAIEKDSFVPAKNNAINITASQIQLDTQREDDTEVGEDPSEKALTLRVSGQLLYGVVKIYSRKTRYLHDDVSVSLIQLKSAFSLTKSLQLDTSVVELDKVLLKDTVEEIGVLYNDFNLDTIFGGQTNNSNGLSADMSSIDYEGDISVGRGGVDVSDANDFDDVADTTIDGLARRAVVNDDLDDIPDFELPLNFDKEGDFDGGDDDNVEDTQIQDAVNDIADFHIDAIDNMDLEFTIDETTVANDQTRGEENTMLDEDLENDGGVDTTNMLRKPKRKYVRHTKEYENLDVVRTQRRKLVVDMRQIEMSTDELKKNQREWPVKRDLKDVSGKTTGVIEIDLVPAFLKKVGVNWQTIKKRKVGGEIEDHVDDNLDVDVNNFEDFGDQSIPDFEVSGFDQHEEVQEDVVVDELPEEEVAVEEETVEEPAVAVEQDEFNSETESSDSVDILSRLTPTNTFKHITEECNVSTTASTFFNLLALATTNKVAVSQDRLFGDISISIK